jgi:hypothetical protein
LKKYQLFLLIQDHITSLLRDCVSETWGAKDFSQAQTLFNEFLTKKNIPINPGVLANIPKDLPYFKVGNLTLEEFRNSITKLENEKNP